MNVELTIKSTGQGFADDPANVGNRSKLTILELAEKVIEMTGSKSKIIFKELPEDDPMQRKPDNTLAKKTLSWEPQIQLEQGLGKTITYFKSLASRA